MPPGPCFHCRATDLDVARSTPPYAVTPADYFHHGLFIPTIALPGQVYRWGPLSNFQAFFISGLPGGIDYLLLGLQKVGKLNHMTEKRINANLNTVRGLRPLFEALCESRRPSLTSDLPPHPIAFLAIH